MNNKDELKAEKRFKVNALGVVESVQVAPPLREADQKEDNPTGKKSNWYNTGNKASGIGGKTFEEEPSASGGTKSTNRNRPSGKANRNKKNSTSSSVRNDTKTKHNENKGQTKDYTIPLVIIVIVVFITLFDIGGSDANVSNVLPEPDEVVVSNANESVFSLLFGLIKNVLSFLWSIISFILNLLFSILGLK